MQNENSNRNNWKQKLEDAGNIPEEMRLNKAAAWEKLQYRLHTKPQRKKAIWYWVAAACLLPFLLLLLVNQHRNSGSLVKQNVPAKSDKVPLIKDELPPQKEVVIVRSTTPVVQKKTGREKRENAISMDTNYAMQIQDAGNDSTAQNLTTVTVKQRDSNIAKTTVLSPNTTKLKVVHINELNEPTEAAPVMVRNSNTHLFPFQIARGEVHGNDVKTIHTTSFISFTAKPLTN